MSHEFNFTIRVRVDGDPPKEYKGKKYALEFATSELARILALDDSRPFAENVYSHLSAYSVSLKAGKRETHHEPAPEGKAQADKQVGFTTEEIEAAQIRNAEAP